MGECDFLAHVLLDARRLDHKASDLPRRWVKQDDHLWAILFALCAPHKTQLFSFFVDALPSKAFGLARPCNAEDSLDILAQLLDGQRSPQRRIELLNDFGVFLGLQRAQQRFRPSLRFDALGRQDLSVSPHPREAPQNQPPKNNKGCFFGSRCVRVILSFVLVNGEYGVWVLHVLLILSLILGCFLV
jgi:hypothetical protein